MISGGPIEICFGGFGHQTGNLMFSSKTLHSLAAKTEFASMVGGPLMPRVPIELQLNA